MSVQSSSRIAMFACAAFFTASIPSVAGQSGLVGGPPWGPALLPTGQYITALAAPGSKFQRIRTGLRPDFNADANGAIASALSPDGTAMVVLTSGYNAGFETTGGQEIAAPYIDPNTGQPSGSQSTGQFQ